jgi:hypothetical protein
MPPHLDRGKPRGRVHPCSGLGKLKGKHIGVVAGTPPSYLRAANGLMAGAKPHRRWSIPVSTIPPRLDDKDQPLTGRVPAK